MTLEVGTLGRFECREGKGGAVERRRDRCERGEVIVESNSFLELLEMTAVRNEERYAISQLRIHRHRCGKELTASIRLEAKLVLGR
jgi:hypothetical protein